MPFSPSTATRPTVPRRRLRRRLLVGVPLVAAAVIIPSALVVAAPSNDSVHIGADISSDSATVGDAISLDLTALASDELYAASFSVAYDAERLAFDADAIASSFPGMYSVIVDETTADGSVTFSVTRLGTSDGEIGDVPIGAFGFTGIAAGDAEVVVESLRVVDSASAITESTAPISFVVSIADVPVVTPPGEVTPPVQPTTPVVITGQGTGTKVTQRPVPVAPQFVVPQTVDAPFIISSATTFSPGDSITLDVSGLTPDTVHDIELHSDPIVLGSESSDSAGDLSFVADIPDDAPNGEHEIVVLENGNPVATLPVVIENGAATDPVDSTNQPETVDTTPGSEALDASTTADATPLGLIIGLGALGLLVFAAIAFVLVRRSRAGGLHG